MDSSVGYMIKFGNNDSGNSSVGATFQREGQLLRIQLSYHDLHPPICPVRHLGLGDSTFWEQQKNREYDIDKSENSHAIIIHILIVAF